MSAKKSELRTLEALKEEHFGKRGTPRREQLEEGYQDYKVEIFAAGSQTKKGNDSTIVSR